MFGITFDGHPNLRRIMMPPTWEGHPLRKDYPARATEFDPFELTKAKQDLEMEALTFKPEEWGMKRGTDNEDFMFLNLGPNHPSAHGAFRIILQLDGEEIVDCVPDIGYHHRGAEKMGERQSRTATSRIPTVLNISAAASARCRTCWRWKNWLGSPYRIA